MINGELGTGFAVQADLETTMKLPAILEHVAKEIRASLQEGKL